MYAFSFPELAGIFQGLAIANSILAVFKPFIYLLIAGIVFYGISYWVDSFSAKEGIQGIADVFKVSFWFVYLIVVIAMLTMTGTFRVNVIPLVIDPTAIVNGNVKVITPNGIQQDLSVDKPYQTLEFKAPAYTILFEFPDALEYSFFQTITFSLDPTKWGGYFANDVLDPNKLFTYCFAKESTEGDYTDAWKFLCNVNGYATGLVEGTVQSLGNSIFYSLGNLPIFRSLPFIKGKAEELLLSGNPDIDYLCKSINKGNSEDFKNRLNLCFDEQYWNYVIFLSKQKKELQKLYAEGKISEGDYKRQLAQINQSKTLAKETVNSLKQSLPLYAKVFLNTTVAEASGQLGGMVQRTITTTGGSILESVKDLVSYFAQASANAYVSERTMLRYYEAFITFMLTITIGIVVPVYLLLSALPNEKSILGFNTKMLLYAVLIYSAVKWSRVGIALLYLIAHGIFLRSVYQ